MTAPSAGGPASDRAVVARRASPGRTVAGRAAPGEPERPSTAVTTARLLLIAGGVLILGIGGAVLLESVSPSRYAGIALWFAGALVLHDGIIAPIAVLLGKSLARAGRALPPVVIATLQGAAVVGATMAAIVLPAAYKQSIGTRNPTVLPLDYGANLLLFLGALAVVTAVAVAVELSYSARRAS